MDALSLMFQNGLKNQASFALPQQLQNEQQMAQAKLKEQQMTNDQSAVMNPLNAQFRQGQIAEQGAALPGIVGQSQSLASQGAVDQATTGDKISERKATLGNNEAVAQAQALAREGQLASALGASLSNYPAYMHKDVVKAAAQKYGVAPDSPVLGGILNGPDEAVAPALAKLGQGMIQASAEFQRQAAENASHEKQAGIHAGATVEAARISAQARVQAAQERAKVTKYMNTDQKITMLSDLVAKGEASPEEEDELKSLKKHVYTAHAVGANAVPAQVMGLPTPTDNASAAAGGGSPAPAAPTAPAGDVASMAKQAWGNYDPASYDYRVGPNGQLQRKSK